MDHTLAALIWLPARCATSAVKILLEHLERGSGTNSFASRAFALDRGQRRAPCSHTFLTPREWKIGHMGDAPRFFADYYQQTHNRKNRRRVVDDRRRHVRSTSWRCGHLYPVQIVIGPEGERRARCLGCGTLGPSSSDMVTALRALKGSVSRRLQTS
jgi:hypothetical protein